MPHTLANLPYQRRVKRGASDLLAVTNMSGMLSQAYQRMSAEPWRPLDVDKPDFPLRSLDISGWLDTYDACNYCGDITAAPVAQKAYAGAVVYSFRLPPDAIAGTPANILSVEVVLRGNRYLSQGAILAIIPSASPEPPEWEDCRAAAWQSPDPAVNEDSPANWRAPLRRLTRGNDGKDTDWRLRWAAPGGSIAAARYLHCVLRLSDYATHTGAWIEGAALFDASQFEVSTDREVARSTEVLTGFYDPSATTTSGKQIGLGILNQIAYDGWTPSILAQRTGAAFCEAVNATIKLAVARGEELKMGASAPGYSSLGAMIGLYHPADNVGMQVRCAAVGSFFAEGNVIDGVRATGFPALGGIVTLRFALYSIPRIFFHGNLLAMDTAMAPAFWRGEASAIKTIYYDDVGAVEASQDVALIHAWEAAGMSATDFVPIPPTRIPPASVLLLAVSPVRVGAAATQSALVGGTYMGYITLTAVLSARIR